MSACIREKEYSIASDFIENEIFNGNHYIPYDILLCNSILRIFSRNDEKKIEKILSIMTKEKILFGNNYFITQKKKREI